MKKILSITLALLFLFTIAACAVETPAPPDTGDPAPAPTDTSPTPTDTTPSEPVTQDDPEPVDVGPFPGVIAIVTNDVSQNEEEFRSAAALIDKYGTDKVIHSVWPANFVAEGEQMITIVQQIAENPDVRALVINQAVVGTNAAVDKLLEIRDDVFIVYVSPAEAPADVAARADLLLNTNDLLRGVIMVENAIKMGAETIAHYSFPRHMAVPILAGRRDIMQTTAEAMGVDFVDLPAPDPTGPDGLPGTQQFILEDVPRQVEALGKNTAFFATNCHMQTPLQIQVIETGSIYIEPCCPSPYHAFPASLGIEDKVFDGTVMADVVDEDGNVVSTDFGRRRTVEEVIAEIRSEVAARGNAGRMGTWPVPSQMMMTTAGFEYAAAFLRGEAPQDGLISYELLEGLMADYMYEVTGTHIEAEVNTFSIQGRSWQNFVLIMMGSLIF